jgi:hypothetical protein
MTHSTKWPNTIPHDLDKALDQIAQYKNGPRNSDLWGVVQDWLQRHGVQAPESLPMRPERPRSG